MIGGDLCPPGTGSGRSSARRYGDSNLLIRNGNPAPSNRPKADDARTDRRYARVPGTCKRSNGGYAQEGITDPAAGRDG